MTLPHPEPPAPRRGVVGPFTGRQLATVVGIVVLAAALLLVATRPLVGPAPSAPPADPRATQYVIGSAGEGLRVGDRAPELEITGPDGGPAPLLDLDGKPVRLADLRGRPVWINFWASWCPVERPYGSAELGSKYQGQSQPTASAAHRDFDARRRLPAPGTGLRGDAGPGRQAEG